QKGAKLTNVAGATRWYNGPSSNAGRLSYSCTLTNGTPGVLDCQDAHTVTVPISAVTLTKGGPTTMYLGQLGRFTLDVQNTGTIARGVGRAAGARPPRRSSRQGCSRRMA